MALIPQRSEAKAKSTSRAGKPRTSDTKTKSNRKAGAKEVRPIKVGKSERVVLLSGGNPRIAKAEGDIPVQAYIAAVPGWDP